MLTYGIASEVTVKTKFNCINFDSRGRKQRCQILIIQINSVAILLIMAMNIDNSYARWSYNLQEDINQTTVNHHYYY